MSTDTGIGTGMAINTVDAPVTRKHVRGKSSVMDRHGLTTEEKQQITTLSADGWPVYRIAKHMNRSPHTVRRYLSQPEAIAEVRDERAELSQMYREKARACVAAIDDDKIRKSSALQLATAAGICTDKALLLAGEPTMNVALLVEVLETMRSQRDRADEAYMRQRREEHGLPAPADSIPIRE